MKKRHKFDHTEYNNSEVEQRLTRLEAKLLETDNNCRADGTHKSEVAGVCSLPDVPKRVFDPNVSPEREALIRYIDKKWVNGTELKYYFFEESPFAGDKANMALVRKGFDVWTEVGIGINFTEVSDIDDAHIRIGFLQDGRTWSYVGRDVIDIPGAMERTMNFGWDLRNDSRGVDTPVHEIGHTLGLPHAHQNPFAGIVWDEKAVYEHFAGYPNYWEKSVTEHNILRKLNSSEVEGSDWDPNSIMHYNFDGGLIISPSKYRDGLTPEPGLSDTDKETIRAFYPESDVSKIVKLVPYKSVCLKNGIDHQQNYVISPDQTRKYNIKSFGAADVLMVLFDSNSGQEIFMAGSDDSGTESNAEMEVRLEANKSYILRVRLFLNYGSRKTAIMIW